MREFSDFIKTINKENITGLFVDLDLTDRAIDALRSDNDRLLELYNEWFIQHSESPYEEIISEDDPYFYSESFESQMINSLNSENKLSYSLAQNIKKVSYLSNETVPSGDGFIHHLSIPLEIYFNQSDKVDSFSISSEKVKDAFIRFSDLPVDSNVRCFNRAYWAVSYPVHVRSEYMLYFMKRLNLNNKNPRFTIDPIRSNDYMYNGIYPEQMREYFIMLSVTTKSPTPPDLKLSPLNERLMLEAISNIVINNPAVDNIVVYPPSKISKSFNLLERLSAKSFILENVDPLLSDIKPKITSIPVYIRTSSVDAQRPYNKNPECFIDLVLPNIKIKNFNLKGGDPAISMRCENSIQAIELLEGLNLLRGYFMESSGSELIFCTAQYEYGKGSMVYSSNADFKDAFSVFKDCIDFYYYDEIKGQPPGHEKNTILFPNID